MSKNNIWVVIPVGKREKYLPDLIDTLNDYMGNIIFINNNKDYTRFNGIVHIEDFDEVNIHRWWNKGIDYAISKGAEYVVVMNDDISLPQNMIDKAVNKMIDNNSLVCGLAYHAGVFFIIKSDSGIRADESLRWWCGDGDIFRQALLKNALIWYREDSFKHFEHNEQTEENEYLKYLGQEDLKTYYKKLDSLNQLEYWKPDYVIQ
jgi:glycosyltransferase involved in cell wall biosynthesis